MCSSDLGEGKHAPAHAPLRAPKITRARQRPPPRAASPPAPRSPTSAASPPAPRSPTSSRRRGARDTCAHSAALATRGGAARGAPGFPAPPRPVSLPPPPTPSGLSRGPGRLLMAPGPTATYPRPSPPGLRAAPYRPRGPVRAPGTGVAVVVALLGRLSEAHATASCQSPEGIPRGTANPQAAGELRVLGLWSWPLHLASSSSPSFGTRSLPTLLPDRKSVV